jgi:hypothetical protein
MMAFLKRYALWILNESESISDVRAILDSYREFCGGHGTH